ncbi:hypothetical protein ACWNX6_00220 [Candidatus Vidania fulgoroideorum]
MLYNIIIDEIRKEKILSKYKYNIKNIKKISFYKLKNYLKEFKKTEDVYLIAEKKKFSPKIGFNKKFNKNLFFKNLSRKKIFTNSILTNSKFFNGNIYTIEKECLKKDFLINYNQLFLSLINNYSYIIIIKKFLSFVKLKNFCKLSKFLGIIPIIEVEKKKDLRKIIKHKIKNIYLGFNSRNLNKFLFEKKENIFSIKKKKLIIYESGISNKNEMIKINNLGFKITLIGENLLKIDFSYEKGGEIHKKKNFFNKKN